MMLCFVFSSGRVFVIYANAFSILRMDYINSQNVITEFALFTHRWYLLNTVTVILVTMYVTVAMVAARTSVVRS